MTPEQKLLIKKSFEQLVPQSNTVACLFYDRLFQLNPMLQALFKSAIVQQGHKFIDVLSIIVNSIDRFDSLLPMLQQLGQRHLNYGVKAEYYDLAAEAFMWSLERGLGKAFTPQTALAWQAAFSKIVQAMKTPLPCLELKVA